jgi:hypothetical protein
MPSGVLPYGRPTGRSIQDFNTGSFFLREVLKHAEAGQFNERSWAYWHYRLELANVDQVPALPVRRFS